MKRILLVVSLCALISQLHATPAAADEAHHARGSLGFHDVSAPIGIRYWTSGEKLGFDLGIGFNSETSDFDANEKVMGYAFDLGVPLVMHSWDNAHLLFRPGLLYQSQAVGFDSNPDPVGYTFDTENQTTFTVMAELEAEIFLRDNFSVSASHGIAFRSFDPGFGADSQTSFGTFGNNFTNIGFHVYCFGGER